MDELTLSAPESPLAGDAFESLLALADDEFVIGHRHSEWLGLSPFLEEDLTMASIAQDELGHARALYAVIWPTWADRDALVTRRPAGDWRSCQLVEDAGVAWETAFVRHLLYDLAEPYRWSSVLQRFGAVEGLGLIVPGVLAEERFHRRHALELLRRLTTSDEARMRLQTQVDRLIPGVSALSTGMTDGAWINFAAEVADVLGDARLTHTFPDAGQPDPSDRRRRSAEFVDVQRSLLDVVAYDPVARW